MANSKISALTSATTPLAGTETLPIVQSSTTKQVSVANLTAGRVVSVGNLLIPNGTEAAPSIYAAGDSTSGIYSSGASATSFSFAGKLAGEFTSANGYWTIYRRNATSQYVETSVTSAGANILVSAGSGVLNLGIGSTSYLKISGSGDVTVNSTNLVIGTSGKGIAYPVTSGGSALAPAFSAYRAGPNQSLTTATFTKVQLNAEEFDTNSNFDLTNYRFTPTVAGYYQISGSIGLTGTNVRVIAAIYKNGSGYMRGIDATANLSQFTVSALVYFNGSTDYVELYAYGSFAGTSDIASGQIYTYFTGVMVRGA
jgi:hypothetical protein